jgi:hypothetical protein
MVVTKKALHYNKIIQYCIDRDISIIEYRKSYHTTVTQHWINLYKHIVKETVEINCLIKLALEEIPMEIQFEIFKYL